MKFNIVTTICAILSSGVFGVPSPSNDFSGRAKRTTSVPTGWTRIGRADQDELLDLSIGLAQPSFHELERNLLEISDPFHRRYGKHLTRDQVEQMLVPSRNSVEQIATWLEESIVVNASTISASAAGDWLYLSLPIRTLEVLLQTEYHVFKHLELGYTVVRTLEWSIPSHLSDHIEVIEPTTNFFVPRPQLFYGAPPPKWEESGRMPTFEELSEEDLLDRGKLEIPSEDQLPLNPTVRQACNRLAISPLCLRVLYGIKDYVPQVPENNTIGIVNFLGEVANRSDIRLYLDRYRPEAVEAADTFDVQLVAGGDDQQTALTEEQLKKKKGYEGALDAQTILGMTWPTKMITYNVGGKPPFRAYEGKTQNTNEPYLAWLKYMRTLDDKQLPSVVSISYAEDEKTVPPAYAQRVCREFALLGARGVSILAASGDDGVGKNKECTTLDGSSMRFAPNFPGSCPYVTSVGATRFLEPEMVAFDARSKYSTGGGFSDLFPQPPYQRQAVAGYLEKLGDKYNGHFNPHGRAFPDVAAMGYHFSVLWNATAHLQDGTSASTPTMAAVIALVNDALIADGRPTLGFLNPWIYSEAHQAFTDVTIGSNLGCNTTGFDATEGWDPASGFGTPSFPKLKALALQSRFRSGKPWYYLGWA